jgi:hypothetical protein
MPAGLSPGAYTVVLTPKRGTPLETGVSYRTDRLSFSEAPSFQSGATFDNLVTLNGTVYVDSRLIVGSPAPFFFDLDVGGTAQFHNSSGTFSVFDYGPGGTDVLVGGFTSAAAGVGPQLRFSDLTGYPFIDIGTNGNGDFEIENQYDTAALTVTQAGNTDLAGNLNVGGQYGGKTLRLNGPIYADMTFESVGADGNDTLIAAVKSDGNLLWTVGSGGSDRVELWRGDAFKPGGGAWSVFSDARLKQNVADVQGALDGLLALRSVTYEYKHPAEIHETPGRHVGFIAQEVEKVFPEWVGEREDGMKYVAVKGFESLTVAALRELRAEKDGQLEALRAEQGEQIEALRAENAALRARLDAIEAALSNLARTRAADGEAAAPLSGR